MKFSKRFPSSSTMSGFGNTHQTAPSASAPPSALDIVASQSANWDALLSPIPDSLTSLPTDDSELIHSPSFILSGSANVPFGTDLDPTSAAISDTFAWDAAAHLRSSLLGATDLHTGFSAGSQAPGSSALSSTFSLMPENASGFHGYPYGSYPLLPVLSTGPYDSPSVSGRIANDDMLVTTVSPAAVSVSQTASATTPSVISPSIGIKPESVTATSSNSRQTPSAFSRAASMDVDEEEDDDEDDADEMDDEDGADEYKERSRGANGARNKESKVGRPASTNVARKSDTASNAESSSKRANKSGGSKQASAGSDSGASTPAPKRRGGNRIAVADFIPPDVTGLSKREARLVKNRAAAFLSRQRKREEFELMEVRLAEILEENARLKSGKTEPSNQGSDEVQRLQAMLHEAQEREQALKSQLEEQTRIAEQAAMQAKVEEPPFTVQEALKMANSPSVAQSPRSEISSLDGSMMREKDSSRHGPGFNLMVLVFSLTLLSMPHQHQLNMRNGGAEPTRISYEPSGSATSAAFPSLFNNVLERWEGGNRFESLDSIDEDDEMEVEVEPWEQEDAAASQRKQGSSYVVDFEMPVLADQVGKDDDGKIKVRISPCGVPRPRQSIGNLKANELAWEGTPLPPLETSSVDYASGSFAADWGSWGGWQDFLSEDIVGPTTSTLAPETSTVDEALSPNSDNSRSEENISERWATPPPFEESMEGVRTPAEGATLATVLSGEQKPTAPVDVDVSLSTLPAWSRAMIQAAAGEKLKARIRVSKKSKIAGRTRSTISLGKKKMGLVVKV